MRVAVQAARVLLGLVFVVFGVNGFLSFIPLPEHTGHAAEFMGLLAGTGYLYAVSVVEVLGGALVLSNRRVPLGLVLLAPVIVNILLFHLLMEPHTMALGTLTLALWLVAACEHREAFRPMLSA
jgi:uncharacterized membrane protein YphA (DoxX/SURF4 family)